jgi:hypothetical protein
MESNIHAIKIVNEIGGNTQRKNTTTDARIIVEEI